MDISTQLANSDGSISCVDMHTTGEPTRIVYKGFPGLSGTLLEQRAQAKKEYDHVRRKLLLEPRGHRDMYGAVLRRETEHTVSGEAHIGVLFMTNEGYSTMCGHATIALGRFLLDTHDKETFPRRDDIKFDSHSKTATLVLHAPCGIVQVTVPTIADGSRSDPTRPVSLLSVPSFASGIDVKVPIPEKYRWPELGTRNHVTVDFSYGGTFYCLIPATELGFSGCLRGTFELSAMDTATKKLKAAVKENAGLKHHFKHPEYDDLGFLYSVFVIDQSIGVALEGSKRGETGVCFFADQQIDRSPTGSGVAARVALAYAKDRIEGREPTTYHSMVSRSKSGRGGFIGSLVEELESKREFPVVRVRVEGFASYVGTSAFVVEDSDPLGDDGFLFERLC